GAATVAVLALASATLAATVTPTSTGTGSSDAASVDVAFLLGAFGSASGSAASVSDTGARAGAGRLATNPYTIATAELNPLANTHTTARLYAIGPGVGAILAGRPASR